MKHTTPMNCKLVCTTNGYAPAPVNTATITLPDELLQLTEKIAENVHEVWSIGRLSSGWTYGEVRNDAVKTHPCLVPYDRLSDSEKEYDRNTAFETLKLIVALGYTISFSKLNGVSECKFVCNTISTNGYTPAPVDTSGITLSEELLQLTEKIAENVHEVWSVGRLLDGWTYGEVRNDAVKTHPCLVPYDRLSDSEKEYDRNTALETIKLIVALGYSIQK